ncbi:MAG: hypothetical protein ACRD29_07030 [Acidimicrobiales bacterium]
MAKATITEVFPRPGRQVEFDFNPDTLKVARSTTTGNPSTASGNGTSPSVLRFVTPAQYTIGPVVLDGDGTQDTCETLIDWQTPAGGFLGKLIGAALGAAASAVTGGKVNLASKPPMLTFTWGSGFILECNVKNCQISYDRFSTSGKPTRATISSLVLEQVPSMLDLMSMNPTSGGAPGRRSHIVTAGENLQRIAYSNYGAPGQWRGLADTNGIDDPLRVKPGRHLYLPNPDELLGSR